MTVTQPSTAAIVRHIDVDAPIAGVWRALTDPALMPQWMCEEGDTMEVLADARAGGAFALRGTLHGMAFENHGTVRSFEAERVFEYDYWSTLSAARLADAPENYSAVRFELTPLDAGTRLTLTLTRFADDSIYRHAGLYWGGTLPILKRFCEQRFS